MKRRTTVLVAAIAAALVICGGPASAGLPDSSRAWTARDAVTSFDFNQDLLRDLGLKIRNVSSTVAADQPGALSFGAPPPSGLLFTAPFGKLENLVGGSLRHEGGFEITWDGGSRSLRNFTVRPGKEPRTLEILDSRGEVLFVADHMHFHLDRESSTLRMYNLDVRLSPSFAQAIGEPRHAGLFVAQLVLQTTIDQPLSGDELFGGGGCGPANWPGTPIPGGGVFQADVGLIGMSAVSQMARGKANFAACDGDPNTCYVVIAPSATLKALGTADVPWYQKNTGTFPPYNNDQHPFLVWQIYRLKDGAFEMLANSGIKHAFLTVNSDCTCASGNILWAANGQPGHPATGCADTYGTGTNNSPGSQGLRHKINPFTGIWDRTGDDFTSFDTPPDRRLAVLEKDLGNAGAQYFFESWYVVRDDINILNTMGWRQVNTTFGGSTWSFSPVTSLAAGPAIDNWVSPTSPPAGAKSVRVDTHQGLMTLAMKTTDLGGGVYRYEYALLNHDFNEQVKSFTVQVPVGATVSNIGFHDIDESGATDWVGGHTGSVVSWAAPAGIGLPWGTQFNFRFDVNAAPVNGQINLTSLNTPAPPSFIADTLAPSTRAVAIFTDGFESGNTNAWQ